MVKKHADLVGSQITTRNGAVLDIVDHNGKTGNHSRHLFYCKVCSSDREMFGDGLFWSRINSITLKGTAPCGCAKHPQWTQWQDYVRVKRACLASGLEYIGWHGDYKGCYTKIHARCPTHGEIKSLSINSLMNSKHGCRECYNQKVRERGLTGQKLTEKYASKCGYPKGTKIIRTDTDGLLKVFCSKCATDEYAAAGLCDGIFNTNISALCSGYRSCRCGATNRKPEKIARFQCESLLIESGIDFIGWKDGYKNSRSKIIASCRIHGTFYPSTATILNGRRCPSCSAGGYSVNKRGYLYLLSSDCGKMMKVGISNNVKKRMKDLVRCTPFGFRLVTYKDMPGEIAPIIEKNILSSSDRLGLSGFNGASEWIRYDDEILHKVNEAG